MLFTSSSFLIQFLFGRVWTDIHLHTCFYTCINSVSITDAHRSMCADTLLLFICSATSPLYSLGLTPVVPVVFTFLSPPVSQAFTDCLTDGVPGSLYRSLCPALCPLQLAVLASCSLSLLSPHPSSWCASQCLPSSRPSLLLTSLEWTYLFPLHLVFFPFLSI